MINLNIRAPWNKLSYGIVSYNLIQELYKLKRKIAYFPIGQPDSSCGDPNILGETLQNQTNYDVNANCLSIWHQFALAERIGKNNLLGFPIFEMDRFTKRETHHLNSCDNIVCPTQWAANIIVEHTKHDNPIVAPLGVDRSIFHPLKIRTNKDTLILLNVGKWEIRKGHDVLPNIISSAFQNYPNFLLLMCCHNPFCSQEEIKAWQKLYLNSPIGNKVRFLNYVNTQNELATIMNSADCGIFISRAEGFNFPALEMLSCGKVIIATNYSGHTEFCNKHNTLLVDIDEVEQAYDGKFFGVSDSTNNGNWVKIGKNQIEQCITHLRTLYKLKNDGVDLVNPKGIETAEKFSWKNCASIINNNI